MKELPKELTPELLGLVLGINDVNNIYEDLAEEGEITYTQYANITRGRRTTDLNLDTLTRLCKEWCHKKGYDLFSGREQGFDYYLCLIYNTYGSSWNDTIKSEKADTELEAVIKATEWVAKEKGIYNES